jgi:hypothetical protein
VAKLWGSPRAWPRVGSEVIRSLPRGWIAAPAATPQCGGGTLEERIPPVSVTATLPYESHLPVVELPGHLRYLGEPLTPGELARLRHRLDHLMVVAWSVFSVLFVSILGASVWLLRLGG